MLCCFLLLHRSHGDFLFFMFITDVFQFSSKYISPSSFLHIPFLSTLRLILNGFAILKSTPEFPKRLPPPSVDSFAVRFRRRLKKNSSKIKRRSACCVQRAGGIHQSRRSCQIWKCIENTLVMWLCVYMPHKFSFVETANFTIFSCWVRLLDTKMSMNNWQRRRGLGNILTLYYIDNSLLALNFDCFHIIRISFLFDVR